MQEAKYQEMNTKISNKACSQFNIKKPVLKKPEGAGKKNWARVCCSAACYPISAIQQT